MNARDITPPPRRKTAEQNKQTDEGGSEGGGFGGGRGAGKELMTRSWRRASKIRQTD